MCYKIIFGIVGLRVNRDEFFWVYIISNHAEDIRLNFINILPVVQLGRHFYWKSQTVGTVFRLILLTSVR